MKRFLSFFLFAILMCGNAVAYDFSAVCSTGQTLYYNITSDTEPYTVEVTSENPSWVYYSTYPMGDIEIPESVTYNNVEYSVTSIGRYAFYICRDLTSVTIPNSVTSINYRAFSGCSGLESLTIGNSVETIGEGAFQSCCNLTEITIPNTVTSIGNQAFTWIKNVVYNGTATGSPWGALNVNGYVNGYLIYSDETETNLTGCNILATEVEIPNTVTSIGQHAFGCCRNLISVTIPSSVTDFGSNAFWECSGLTSVNYFGSIEGWCRISFSGDYYSNPLYYAHNLYINNNLVSNLVIPNTITEIKQDVFSGASCLTSVTIPSSVTSIGQYAFYHCSGLTGSLTIPNSVTSIGDWAFNSCSSLTVVSIGDSVVNIGENTFTDCHGLSEPIYNANIFVYFPEYYVTEYTIPIGIQRIANYAFSHCYSLETLTISDSVKFIADEAFSGCSLTTINFNARNCYTNSNSLFEYCWSLTTLNIGNGVEYISSNLFSNCRSLTEISIPNSVTGIGEQAFYGTGWYENQSDGILYLDGWCLGYKGNMPNGELMLNYNIRGIAESAFYNCEELTGNLTIPNSVTSIDYGVFSGCSGLTSVTIPNSITSIGGEAFYGCSGLTSVYYTGDVAGWCRISFGENGGNPVRYAHNLYINNELLTNLIIPETITKINDYAFSGCSGLTGTLTIPESVTSIGESAFSGCSGLTGTLTIPESVTSIGVSAFLGCSGLTSVTIPNSVTSIGFWAFHGCSKLNLINFNATNCTTMGNSSGPLFSNCTALTTLNIGENVESISEGAFAGCNGLSNIYANPTIPPRISNSFSNYNAIVWVPCNYGETYRATNGWSSFDNINERRTYVLDVSSANIEQGTAIITQQPNCTDGTAIIKATPALGYGFVSWSDGNTDNPRTVNVSQDTTFTAEFYAKCLIDYGICGINADNLTWELSCDSVLTISGTGAMVDYDNDNRSPWHSNSAIKYVVITDGVASIGNFAFYGCTELISITIPNSVTSIGEEAFLSCSGLTGELSIPNSVTSIGDNAFWGCSGLTSVTIPNSVTSIGESAFYGCSGIESIVVDSDNQIYDSRNDCNAIIETATSTLIQGCKNTEIHNSVTSIGRYAFYGCGVTSVTIPNSVTSIGYYAFGYCSELTSVNYNATNCTSMGGSVWYNCPLLTTLIIGENVTNIPEEAFEYCSSLTEITIPNSVTSIGEYAFRGCSGLRSVNFNATNCTYMGSSNMGSPFYSCTSLSTLNIGENVTNIPNYAFAGCSDLTGTLIIPDSVLSIGNYAFVGCSGLTSSIIGSSVTSIGELAFFGCSGLTTVTIPNSVTSIGRSAFQNCSGMTSIIISESVISIGREAFKNCSGLIGELTIPNSVTSIGVDAFSGCSGLETVTIGYSVENIAVSVFENCIGLTTVNYNATNCT